jgi:ribosome biogenesis GTPase
LSDKPFISFLFRRGLDGPYSWHICTQFFIFEDFSPMSIYDYGWSEFFSSHFESIKNRTSFPARVMRVDRGGYLIATDAGEKRARLPGRQIFKSEHDSQRPVVGDWVVCEAASGSDEAVVLELLARQTLLSRKSASTAVEEQAVAANVDYVFLVMGLDSNFNLRRLERLLTMTYESGALPFVVLNKSDLCNNLFQFERDTASVAPGVQIRLVSCMTGEGLEQLQTDLTPRKTIVFVGSSGVGKSTLINRLFGEKLMATKPVRGKDGRGRHTTTHRQLLRHPGGALLIDNPGIRELQLWGSEEALDSTFEEIDDLADQCRFRDCSHSREPGCAVREAVEKGFLIETRFKSYLSLRKELRYLAMKQDQNAMRAERQKWKSIQKSYRELQRLRSREE